MIFLCNIFVFLELTDLRESDEQWSSSPDGTEDLRLAVLADIVCDFEESVRTSALRMDHSFRDAFSVELLDLIHEDHVLQNMLMRNLVGCIREPTLSRAYYRYA